MQGGWCHQVLSERGVVWGHQGHPSTVSQQSCRYERTDTPRHNLPHVQPAQDGTDEGQRVKNLTGPLQSTLGNYGKFLLYGCSRYDA